MPINPFLPRRSKRLSDHFLRARIRAYRRILVELCALEGDFARRTKAQLEEGLAALEFEAHERQARTYDQRLGGAA